MLFNKVFKIFVDFDGTITTEDVGESIFREFGKKDKINDIIVNLLSDKISARKSWELMCKAVDKIDKKTLDDFINKMEIDPTFKGFVDYCNSNNMELFVLSDGFDYYINKIFRREKLEHLRAFSNHMELKENKLIPSFPYLDSSCFSSANCKRNHIINNSSDEDYTVFIGDGNSDKYTCQFCDFIFAKDDLLKFCEVERITYFPYKNFSDVVVKLEQLRLKKRLKKRYQAELKRREAYISE